MSQIEVKHNGEKITYAENEDVWRCWALKLEAKTLSALKTKVNQWHARRRRVDNVPVLLISNGWSSTVEEGQATLLDADDKSVWVMSSRTRYGGNTSDSGRTKVKFEDMALDIPEARLAIDQWQRLQVKAAEASAEANAALIRILRASVEQFRHLAQDDLTVERKRK